MSYRISKMFKNITTHVLPVVYTFLQVWQSMVAVACRTMWRNMRASQMIIKNLYPLINAELPTVWLHTFFQLSEMKCFPDASSYWHFSTFGMWNSFPKFSALSSFTLYTQKQTLWPETACRPSDRRLSEKLVSTFADRGCQAVSVTDPYGRNLGFLDHFIHAWIWKPRIKITFYELPSSATRFIKSFTSFLKAMSHLTCVSAVWGWLLLCVLQCRHVIPVPCSMVTCISSNSALVLPDGLM
jgi:hypothetical protein